MLYTEINALRDRIDNWRRHYRTVQKIAAVPYYQPPVLGEVFEDDKQIKLPTNMRDAVILESAWRNLPQDSAVKHYLKWSYILRNPPQPIWRRLKQYGVRIKNDIEFQRFDIAALEIFKKLLGEF